MIKLYKNPWLVLLVSLFVTVVGLKQFIDLPIALYPNTTKAVVNVRLPHPMMHPEDLKTQYGKQIESVGNDPKSSLAISHCLSIAVADGPILVVINRSQGDGVASSNPHGLIWNIDGQGPTISSGLDRLNQGKKDQRKTKKGHSDSGRELRAFVP